MRLKYKSFEFPSNPANIEILSSTNCSSSPVFAGSSVVENISVNPIVVKGSGEFYGGKCEEYCTVLGNLLECTESGWLFTPLSAPMKAYFTEFEFSKNTEKNAVEYSFKFTEDCNARKAYIELPYIIAEENENAFEIANRYNVSVNEIMRLNDFKSPFDISAGDRVVLR